MSNVYPEGFRFFKPRETAPSFVKAEVKINIKEFSDFINSPNTKQYLSDYKGNAQLKLTLKENKEGVYYFEVDTFKPQAKQEAQAETVSDLPF
jgi:ribosomal protein S6